MRKLSDDERARIRERARKVAAGFPPLTDAQRVRIAGLLRRPEPDRDGKTP